ncbi:MAG: hypothetical protein KA250_09120 [Verrucomicrobiales bacterium]|nr:hypothetical protein [Verrucomicrobiales bacterium]MBP9222461.1 hypothetical protein [Verrucomicrobiales bacterium]HQZ27613.1 hypothetical protein [Verrucomicrobiales bacterium]
MKFAIFFPALFLCFSAGFSRASESAVDSQAAVDTLVAGVEVHPNQAAVLFQDALQTNPDSKRELLVAALRLASGDVDLIRRLIFIARVEFSGEDNLFAEAALTAAPESGADIRDAFLATPHEMQEALASAPTDEAPLRQPSLESQRMDEDIRDAIARMTAKVEGKPWPEQHLSDKPVTFRKADDLRISLRSRDVDESSLNNTFLRDQDDERELVPRPVRLDDARESSTDLRLDESKFTSGDRSSATGPLMAGSHSIAPAGAVGLPVGPALRRSSVYFISPSADQYLSTVDREEDEMLRPPLIIRSAPTSPTSPR